MALPSLSGLPGDVRVELCDVGNCTSRCGARVLPEASCVLPVAPSGLGVPAIFRCLDGGVVNATFFENDRGVCDGRSLQWGGSYREGECVHGAYLSYRFKCMPAASSQ